MTKIEAHNQNSNYNIYEIKFNSIIEESHNTSIHGICNIGKIKSSLKCTLHIKKHNNKEVQYNTIIAGQNGIKVPEDTIKIVKKRFISTIK